MVNIVSDIEVGFFTFLGVILSTQIIDRLALTRFSFNECYVYRLIQFLFILRTFIFLLWSIL